MGADLPPPGEIGYILERGQTWWDRPGHKQMTHIDNGPGPGCNKQKRPIYFCQKQKQDQKSIFTLKKTKYRP